MEVLFNFITPVFFIYLALILILDGKKFAETFNGGIGMILGAFVGYKSGFIIFGGFVSSIITMIIFAIFGFQIHRFKKIKYNIIAGISWGLLAVLLFSVINVYGGGLIFLAIFFFLSGCIFSYFYYSEILAIAGFSFLGANILFLSTAYGLENIVKNSFEIFYFPYSFYKFIYLYRINFFQFIIVSILFIVFSIYFQRIVGRKNVDKKTRILSIVLKDSAYSFAIIFFMTEILRIIINVDIFFIFGISSYNWPVLAFITYWFLAFIRRQEQMDSMVDGIKPYKRIMSFIAYSIILIPFICLLTNYSQYSVIDFFGKELSTSIPKISFNLIMLPFFLNILYPKRSN